MNVKKGDTVIVIAGNDKGKTGKILRALVKENRVIVEGVNIVSRHTKPSNAHPDGGIIKKEAPICASNVKSLIQKIMSPVRIAHKIMMGKKCGYCRIKSIWHCFG